MNRDILQEIDYSKQEDKYIGELLRTKLDRIVTEKDVKECASEEVCDLMQRLFTNSWDPQLSIINSNLVFDKYDRPTMQLEIKISNCKTIEDIKKIRDKLSEVIRDTINVINDYGC